MFGFKSKVAAIVLGGGTLVGAGLVFTGTEKLEEAKQFAIEAGNKIVQYEANEQTLIGKYSDLKGDLSAANDTIEEKEAAIAEQQVQIDTLTSQKAELEGVVADLRTEVANIQEQLNQATGDVAALEEQLANKEAALNEANGKLTEANNKLAAANKKVKDLEQLLQYAYDKAKEADNVIVQLEAEIKKANNEVDKMHKEVEKVKQQTADKEPLSEDEIENLDQE
jgi:chromosome segregation ATPase